MAIFPVSPNLGVVIVISDGWIDFDVDVIWKNK